MVFRKLQQEATLTGAIPVDSCRKSGVSASRRLCSRAFFRALEVTSKKEIYLSYSLLTSEIGSDIFVLLSDK